MIYKEVTAMIFCVEDDAGIRDLMIYTLTASGFEAEGFADGAVRHRCEPSIRPLS